MAGASAWITTTMERALTRWTRSHSSSVISSSGVFENTPALFTTSQ